MVCIRSPLSATPIRVIQQDTSTGEVLAGIADRGRMALDLPAQAHPLGRSVHKMPSHAMLGLEDDEEITSVRPLRLEGAKGRGVG